MSRSPSLVPDNHAFDALASMLDCCQAMRDAAKSGDEDEFSEYGD